MALKTFRMEIRITGAREKHLPDIIKAVQKAGRLLHGDAMLILGGDEPPEIVMFGEDLTQEKQS